MVKPIIEGNSHSSVDYYPPDIAQRSTEDARNAAVYDDADVGIVNCRIDKLISDANSYNIIEV